MAKKKPEKTGVNGVDPPPPLRESVRLPDMVRMPKHFREGLGRGPEARYLEPGLYDAYGRKVGELFDTSPDARVVVQFAGVTFVWGAFGRRLEPDQQGWLRFENVPGSMPITPFFNEWDRDEAKPSLGDALLPLLSSERGRDVARVAGRNDGDDAVWAAAGFIVSQELDLPPARRET
jgi:hypothetical protein